MAIKDNFFLQSSSGKDAKIFVRKCVPIYKPKQIMLLLHGATMPSIIFDLKIDGISMMEHLAGQGIVAYALDYRGYGWSTKPKEMDNLVMEGNPLITHIDAAQDVEDLLEHIKLNHPGIPISICGFSWGSNIAGFVTLRNDISNLILIGPVYSFKYMGWEDLADHNDIMKLNKGIRSYRIVHKNRWIKPWNEQIPADDKDDWRNPDLLNDLCNEIESSDKEWANNTNNKGSIRVPSGVLQDAHRVYSEQPIYEASLIKCSTLVIRGEQESFSHADIDGLVAKLQCKKQMIEIPNATHYGILEKGAHRFFKTITDFVLI